MTIILLCFKIAGVGSFSWWWIALAAVLDIAFSSAQSEAEACSRLIKLLDKLEGSK